MTAPTTTASVTNPYTLNPGDPPVRITDGTNNSPAGLTLTNRGDNGGTLWVMGGPNAQAGALPLGPGASLQWSDVVNLPYAYLAPAATKPETLVVSSQSGAYSNPTVVSAALVAQGIPSTMIDTDYGGYNLQPTASTNPISVGASSTLIVGVSWPQPTPQGANVLRLRFDDPASPNLSPLDYFLTAPNAISQEQWTWQVPVVAPRLTITNVQPYDNNNAPAFVDVVGNNRPAPDGLRMLGSPQPGAAQLWAATTVTTGGTYDLQGGAHTGGISSNQPAAYAASGSRVTRFTGACTASLWANSAPTQAFLYQNWINAQGQPVAMAYSINNLVSGAGQLTIAHPPVPCYWRLFVNNGSASAVAQVLIAQN